MALKLEQSVKGLNFFISKQQTSGKTLIVKSIFVNAIFRS